MVAILVVTLTACSDSSTQIQESQKTTESATTTTETSQTTIQAADDNNYSRWNSIFIAENGDTMTFDISDSGSVDYEYRYVASGTASFTDENTEINDNIISMYGADSDSEYGAEFTLDGDVLHCMAWNKLVEETEKYVYMDIDMYRDGKLANGTEVTIEATTVAETVYPEEIYYMYKVVNEYKTEDWDYYIRILNFGIG